MCASSMRVGVGAGSDGFGWSAASDSARSGLWRYGWTVVQGWARRVPFMCHGVRHRKAWLVGQAS